MSQPPAQIGRYEIVERIGRGAMGILYRGRDRVLDREVAIKVMDAGFSEDEAARNRFFREARAAARLQHRNVVTVFEFAEYNDTPYIVMEFLRGGSLAARRRGAAEFPLTEKLDIVIQLCAGLEAAHREGVVHRDVKPGNVWICGDGLVKLLDFGIAKSTAATITNSGVIGSPSYMSPEQIAGRELDGRSDVFSAGVVLYELLSGVRPFEAESPTAVMLRITTDTPRPLQEIAPGLPNALIAAVGRALQKDPDERYARAADLAADLRLVLLNLDGENAVEESVLLDETLFADAVFRDPPPPVPANDPPDAAPALPPVASRRRRLWPVAAAASLAVVVLAGVVAINGRADGTPETSSPAAPVPAPDGGKGAPPVITLRLSSTPAGASVRVDGVGDRNTTPYELPIAGDRVPRRLRFEKADHDPVDVAVTEQMLRDGAAHAVLPAVVRVPGRVAISGLYAFEVIEGARVLSRAADSHQLTLSGRHTLRLRAREVLLDRVLNVDPPAGGRVELRAPGVGQIVVQTPPPLETCTVFVGDVSLGSPPTDVQRIVEGTHTVRLKCPSGQNREQQVSVKAGELRREIIR